MLNQFIQAGIQVRNIGLVAIGCLIDGVMAVVGGFRSPVKQLLHYLTGDVLHRDRILGGRGWLLTYQFPISQPGKQLTLHLDWQQQQG